MPCVKLKPLKGIQVSKVAKLQFRFGILRLSSPKPNDKVEKACQSNNEIRHCMFNDVCNMWPTTQYV